MIHCNKYENDFLSFKKKFIGKIHVSVYRTSLQLQINYYFVRYDKVRFIAKIHLSVYRTSLQLQDDYYFEI